MDSTDTAIQFKCEQDTLLGILSTPAQAPAHGVLIVVGGPQYRVGSHRQFALLARDLATGGFAAMRFDYRGMGDSEGALRSFNEVEEDLRSAVNAFFAFVPTLQSITLWGLCDGACAALFYAPTDARVKGVVLLNPWIYSETGAARTTLKHYYLGRLQEREFWHKVLRGRFNPTTALSSLAGLLKRASTVSPGLSTEAKTINQQSLQERMLDSAFAFQGKVLLILSGRDLTAKQFLDAVSGSKKWRAILHAPRVCRHDLEAADHTFSRRVWRDQVSTWTRTWLGTNFSG